MLFLRNRLTIVADKVITHTEAKAILLNSSAHP